MFLLIGAFLIKANGQGITVTGVVADAKGEPLIGVNIVEKGLTNGTVTDIDGKFTIKVSSQDAVLSFTYIGYDKQELKVGDKTSFNITMAEQSQKLEEVVVIGYGTAKKKDLTGAISSIKADKFEVEAPRSVQDMLRANMPGLSISMSSNAKGSANMQIRGKNTLKAGSSPLLVVDGVIFEGSMEDINPMDIESVDMLKDASSAAVYGSKSANGVIVITTKKGKTGKPVVNFNVNMGFAQVANQKKVLSPSQFIDYRTAYELGKRSDDYLAQHPEMYSDPRKLSGVSQLDWYNYDQSSPVSSVTEDQLVRTWLSRLDFKSTEIENYMNGRITDWADEVFQTGLQQDYTASVSNRSDNMSYYWSLGYTDRDGIISGDNFSSFRTRLNLESIINKWFTVGINSSFSSRDEGSLPADWEQMTRISPYGANEIGNPDAEEMYKRYPTGDRTPVNPFYDNMYTDRRRYYNTLNASIYAKVKLPLGIEYQMNFIPNYQWSEYYNHESSENINIEAVGGKSVRMTKKVFSWQVDNVFRWKKEFAKVHNVEATFLVNAEKYQSWRQKISTQQYTPNDVLGWHRVDGATTRNVSSSDEYQTGDALMGRLFYSYNNRYMVTASVRRDGYSAFGLGDPHAVFPAVALGWVFSSEKFMKPAEEWLSYGKLRVSWGKNGNRDVGKYEALYNMVTGPYYYIDQNGKIYQSSQLFADRLQNAGLKWENTGSYNVGLDFAFLNDLITGNIDAYFSKTNDLLVDRVLPKLSGYEKISDNLGEIKNKGVELNVTGNFVKRDNISWSTSFNFSLNRRKITKLYGEMIDVVVDGKVVGQREADDIQNKWFIGQDPDRIWDYKRIGVWQVEEADEAAKFGLQPGDYKYKDVDGNGIMTDDDKVFQGYKTPRFRWTWRNDFTFYKNINLSFMMYSFWGHYDKFNRAANSSNPADRCTEYVQPYWTAENRQNDYARIGSNNIGTNYVSRSFIRLDNITLSYNVPSKFLTKLSVQGLRISASVRNVAVFSPHWKFWDPERGWTYDKSKQEKDEEAWKEDENSTPTPRTFSLSVNFTL